MHGTLLSEALSPTASRSVVLEDCFHRYERTSTLESGDRAVQFSVKPRTRNPQADAGCLGLATITRYAASSSLLDSVREGL